jgi:hypothetical protein
MEPTSDALALDERNAAVQELWDDFAHARNPRGPFTFACDEQAWLKVAGETFGRFYQDPRVHLDVQLRGKLWWAESCVGDQAAGLPERWQVAPQWWMEENEHAGCTVAIQADDYAWARPLDLELRDIPAHLSTTPRFSRSSACPSGSRRRPTTPCCSGAPLPR